MKPSYWKYSNPDKQTVTYRGRVAVYNGHYMEYVSCKKVHKNHLLAIADAKKLIKKLKLNHETNTTKRTSNDTK